jgi:hypothetical protein
MSILFEEKIQKLILAASGSDHVPIQEEAHKLFGIRFYVWIFLDVNGIADGRGFQFLKICKP